MKVLPKLCAAVACAAFTLATGDAWAENLENSQHSSKGIKNPSGKQGAKTSSNRMAKADGKQPHKKAPTNYKDPSVSTGVSRGEAAGKRSGPGRSSLNEVDVGKVSGASNNKLFGDADPNGPKSQAPATQQLKKGPTVDPPPK
jgi:hypothetical protein